MEAPCDIFAAGPWSTCSAGRSEKQNGGNQLQPSKQQQPRNKCNTQNWVQRDRSWGPDKPRKTVWAKQLQRHQEKSTPANTSKQTSRNEKKTHSWANYVNVDGFRFALISPCQNAMKQVPSKFQWEMKNKTFVEAFPNLSDLCQSCHIWLRIKALQLLIRISQSVCMWPAQCLNSSLL